MPSNWRTLTATACDGDVIAGPALIVGSFRTASDCLGINPNATVAVLGYGGQPFSPIPDGHERDMTVNGVDVQLLTGRDDIDGASQMLALFPGRNAWLEAEAPGTESATGLRAAQQVLATVHSTPGSRPTVAPPIRESFIGTWYVHGAQLDIRSNTLAIESVTHGCNNDCLENYYLALSPSYGGTRMTATVTKITYTDPTTDKPVRSPNTSQTPREGDALRVGDSFTFQFVEPHLMLEVEVRHTIPGSDAEIGNPYWCGKGLAEEFSPACGA